MPPVPKLIVRELADCRVLHYLRERQGEPCHVMQMLNALTKLDRPRNRKERRRSFGWHLERLPVLLREGVIRRCGRKHVIMLAPGQALPPLPSPVGPRRAEVEYAKRLAIEARLRTLAVHRRDAPTVVLPPSNEPKTESANAPITTETTGDVGRPEPLPKPSPVLLRFKKFFAVRSAAKTLARLPRKQERKWTGWLNGIHCWHGKPVTLPDGSLGLLMLLHRDRALVCMENAEDIDGFRIRPFLRQQLRVAKNPAAVLIGSLKRGVREKQSERKAEAARRNGCCPCRPGRKRGRPAGLAAKAAYPKDDVRIAPASNQLAIH